MRQRLILHPDSRCEAITGIEVEIARKSGRLELHYIASGAMDDLYLPPFKGSGRADELWTSTCFEAFLRAPPKVSYYEFNFSPSMQWAAYRFDGYRAGMQTAETITPELQAAKGDHDYRMRTVLSLKRISDVPADAVLSLGLSAVIEETNGRKSYWALKHPPGKADFHHSDGFALQLAGASHP